MLALIILSCGGNDDSGGSTTPTPDENASSTPEASPASGTPAEPDPALARQTFESFVDAVQAEELERAWELYIASVPGDLMQHNAQLGCAFFAFADEFTRMQHMFERIAPLEVEQEFGAATGSLTIELALTGADGNPYLATLFRDPPDAPYRLRSFNNGRAANEPGVPDPFPSPEDPQGYCAIWTGPR